MDPEQKIKPIRELLQDIGSNSPTPHEPRGLVPLKSLDRIIAVVSLVLVALSFLAIIWDLTDALVTVRFIGSVFVVVFTLFVFRFINMQFD